MCRLTHILSQQVAHTVPLVIHSNILNRVGSKVFKHKLTVAVKQVAPIQQQIVYFLSVAEYLTTAPQLHSGHLLQQSVKHRPVRQNKGIGIIYQRVTLMVEHDFRGRHTHLPEIYLSETAHPY